MPSLMRQKRSGATAQKPSRASQSHLPRITAFTPKISWMTTTVPLAWPAGLATYARNSPSLPLMLVQSAITRSQVCLWRLARVIDRPCTLCAKELARNPNNEVHCQRRMLAGGSAPLHGLAGRHADQRQAGRGNAGPHGGQYQAHESRDDDE